MTLDPNTIIEYKYKLLSSIPVTFTDIQQKINIRTAKRILGKLMHEHIAMATVYNLEVRKLFAFETPL